MGNENDFQIIVEEGDSPPAHEAGHERKILIVDDDDDVHQATTFALQGQRILEHPIKFLHATTAAEAKEVLARESDIAVILLDVVMESGDAGLRLVEYIRFDLGLTQPRIILRTGQPGYAPELSAIRDYDINDYRMKSELTRTRLFTTITSSIRAYDHICKLEESQRGLESIIATNNQLLTADSLTELPAQIIQKTAELLGSPPEGLACSYKTGEEGSTTSYLPSEIVVLAAAGSFEQFAQKNLNDIPIPSVQNMVLDCFSLQSSQIGDKALVLHLPSQTGKHLAIYLEITRPLTEIEHCLLEVFSSNMSICAENTRLLNRLHDQAYVDRLVRLPTRIAFVEAIDHQIKARGPSNHTVCIINIDQFAETNEAFGHNYGDAILRGIAQRLHTHFGKTCELARIAGDTFGVLGLSSAVSPESLRPLFISPLPITDEIHHQISVSMGFVHLSDALSGHEAIKKASLAVKIARTGGPGRDAFYTHELGQNTRERTHLLHSLQSAFHEDRLFLAYQPQIDIASQKTIGFEALMRCRDKQGIFIPPDLFIPLSEQSGMISIMGQWAMRSALQTLRTLNDKGWSHLRMAINVSVVQFQSESFVKSVAQAIEEAGVLPSMVELEITESVAMMSASEVTSRLQALKALGVTIAIDDFGTGFSSLSYLERLPLDRLKIDRSFVNTIGDTKEGERITEMIINLGYKLDMTLIAEGVEHEKQLERLAMLGCHEAQGYLFGMPMEAENLDEWLRNNP